MCSEWGSVLAPGHQCLISLRTHDQCNQNRPPAFYLSTWTWKDVKLAVLWPSYHQEHLSQKRANTEAGESSVGEMSEVLMIWLECLKPWAFQFLEPTAFLLGLTYIQVSVLCRKNPNFSKSCFIDTQVHLKALDSFKCGHQLFYPVVRQFPFTHWLSIWTFPSIFLQKTMVKNNTIKTTKKIKQHNKT